MSDEIHQQIMALMQPMVEKFAAQGIPLQLPPASNLTLGTRYVAVDFGKSLTAEIPFDLRFTNPLKMFQGGFMSAAIDEVYGPLTYMAAERPVLTVEMSTTFIRPFVANDEFIRIKADVVAKTRNLIILKAEVLSKAGKLLATSTNHSIIATDQNLKGG